MARRTRTTRRRGSKAGGAEGFLVVLGLALVWGAVRVSIDYWPVLVVGLSVLALGWVIRQSFKAGEPNAPDRTPATTTRWVTPTVAKESVLQPTRMAAAVRAVPAAPALQEQIAPKAAALASAMELRIAPIVDPPRPTTPEVTFVPPSRSAASSPRAKGWIGADQTVELRGVRIARGLIYIGERLPQPDGQWANFLIDPNLPVSKPGSGSGAGLPYWPRYDALSPVNRRRYLDWLASDRSDPHLEIGFIFLYFYGLEHRLFKEQARGDGPALLAEVERLMTIYGGHHAFHTHAGRFIEAARLATGTYPQARPAIHLDPDHERFEAYGFEWPLEVRLWLGRKLAASEAFDADDTLLWLAAAPDASFRTPVTRCTAEFETLWRLRFTGWHPKGLQVRPAKTKIKTTYRAASGSFEADIEGDHTSFPDVTHVQAPLQRLRSLVDACTNELDPFSRLIGRQPEARSSVEALMLLPADLPIVQEGLLSRQQDLQRLMGTEPAAVVPLSELVQRIGLPALPPGRVSAAMQTRLQQVFDRLGFGIEPDRRYGRSTLDAAASVVAFASAKGAPVDPTRSLYETHRNLIDIVALAAAADGSVERAELEVALRELQGAAELSTAERDRLTAYAVSLQLDPPKLQAVFKRLATRPLVEREACARLAIAAVMADDQATAAEVAFLERLHRALLLPADTIYQSIHRGAGSRDTAAPETGGQRMSGRSSQGVVIDGSRLAHLRRETQAVSAFLSGIFVDDTQAAPRTAIVPITDPSADGRIQATDPRFTGLDAAHADLLSTLLPRENVDRCVFDEEARSRRLLPDGALETINEWAFDRFGEMLIDDDMTMNHHLRSQLVVNAPA